MKLILPFAILLFPLVSLAAAGSAVNHSHGERSHSHPLPKSGLKHSHDQGKGKGKTNSPKVSFKVDPKLSELLHKRDNELLVSNGWPALSSTWYVAAYAQRGFVAFKYGSSVTEGQYETVVIQNHTRAFEGAKETKVSTQVAKVKSTDCKREMGQVVFHTLSGLRINSMDFVVDGSALIDTIGDQVCIAARAGI